MFTPWPWQTQEDVERILRERLEHRPAKLGRRSRMARFYDAHERWECTKDTGALQERIAASTSGSPEDTKRAGEFLAGVGWQEGEDRRTRLRRHKFTGWRKKG